MHPGVNVEISKGVATITFNRPKSLNAITAEGVLFPSIRVGCRMANGVSVDYDAFSEALYAIDKRDDVTVTIWQGA